MLEALTAADRFDLDTEVARPIELSELDQLPAEAIMARAEVLAKKREERCLYAIECIEAKVDEQRAKKAELEVELAEY